MSARLVYERIKIALDPARWSRDAVVMAAVAGAAITLAQFILAFESLDSHPVDFVAFYRAVEAWRAGGALYSPALINYNPPQFLLLLLPLSWLSLRGAFVVWTVISAAAAVGTVTIGAAGSRAWPARHRLLLAAAVLVAAGDGLAIQLGQVSWVVALVIALGWRAARRGRLATAGAWIGLAASLKPFLIVLAVVFVLRHRAVAAIACAGAAGLALAVGAFAFGPAAVGDWVRLLAAGAPPDQIRFFINASLSAGAVRAGFPQAVAGIALTMAVATIVSGVRASHESRAWLIGVLGSILSSPIGWIYYLPLLAAPLIASAGERRLGAHAWHVWPLLAVPVLGREVFETNTIVALSAGSVYMWGLTALWAMAVFSRQGKHGENVAADALGGGISLRRATNDLPVSTTTS